MSGFDADDMAIAPEIRARNLRLGLLLGAIALGVVITFMVVFTRHGLPKDPAEWNRLQRLESARLREAETIGGAEAAPMVAPTAGDRAAESKPKKDER